MDASAINHGTRWGYNKRGCRCAECSAAQSAYMKGYRARKPAAYQRELAANRKRKESYRGVCERCGSPTWGDGPGRSRRLCASCNGRLISQRRVGRGPLVQKLLGLVDERPLRYSEIVALLGISNGHASNLLYHAVRHGLVERADRGIYARPGGRAT